MIPQFRSGILIRSKEYDLSQILHHTDQKTNGIPVDNQDILPDVYEPKNRHIRPNISLGNSNTVCNTPFLFTPPSLKSELNFLPHEGQAISTPPMFLGNLNCCPHLGHFFSVWSVIFSYLYQFSTSSDTYQYQVLLFSDSSI